MAKRNITKIINTGYPKQRILLLAEDIARAKFFQEKLLTDLEFNQLTQSFNTPNEIKLYEKFHELDDTLTNALVNLQGKLFEVNMNKSNLRGYILYWNAIENAELMVNSVLHNFKDSEERKKIAEDSVKGIYFLFSKTEPQEEGYVDIKVDFKLSEDVQFNFLQIMNNVKKEVERSIIKYKSWEKAIIDFMDDKGFNVKSYKAYIKNLNNQMNTPIIGWDKYSGKLEEDLRYPRLEKIMKNYAICPIMEDLEVDEEEYNWFRINFLDKSDYPENLRGKVNEKLTYE